MLPASSRRCKRQHARNSAIVASIADCLLSNNRSRWARVDLQDWKSVLRQTTQTRGYPSALKSSGVYRGTMFHLPLFRQVTEMCRTLSVLVHVLSFPFENS